MSLFANLFKKKPAIESRDPVFGHLTYEEGIWSFIPKKSGDGSLITIAAPESGPTQLQREFFQKIFSDLIQFERTARHFMRSRVEQSVDVSRLSTYSIEIGTEDESRSEHFVLEMSDNEAIVIHRVTFIGSKPVDYGFDD